MAILLNLVKILSVFVNECGCHCLAAKCVRPHCCYFAVTVCLSVVSVFSSHCSDLVVLWGVLVRCPSDMFLPSGLVGQDTLSCGALQTRHKYRNQPFCLKQPLGVVVLANFSLSYTNPGPTLKVCLLASDIISGELVVWCFRVGKEGTETAQVSYAATVSKTDHCLGPPPVYFNFLLLDKRGYSGRK